MTNTLFSQIHLEEKTIKFPISGDQLAIDRIGNFYVIKDAVLQKFSNNGELLFSFSNFSFGNITSVDVSNYLKIMIFYGESSTLLFLDDRLSPISDPIDLFSRQYTTIALAAYSADNRTWLYDFANSDLIILDIYFNKIDKIHYNFPHFQPTQLIEIQGKQMSMYNPMDGLYIYDSFGTFDKKIRIETAYPVQIVDHTIYYIKDGNFYGYHYQKLSEEMVELNLPDMKQCLRYKNMLFILKTDGEIWKINL